MLHEIKLMDGECNLTIFYLCGPYCSSLNIDMCARTRLHLLSVRVISKM